MHKPLDTRAGDLSYGQQKLLELARALLHEHQLLMLDEPAAGLDPKGRDEILSNIKKLHKEYNMTIILVSHSMEEVAKVADRVFVLSEGKCILQGSIKEVFKQSSILEEVGLAVPQITYLIKRLNEKGFELPEDVFTVEQAKEVLLKRIRV